MTGARRVARIAALLLLALQAASSWALAVGDPAPELSASASVGGAPMTLATWRGQWVYVDFWASWCGPCKKAFPVMKELHETFASRGFLVLAISLDEKKSDMEGFLAKTKPPFPTLRDPKGKLAEELAVDAIPTSVLVGSDGKVLAVHSGFEGEASRNAYVQEIETALKTAGR